MSRSRYGHLQLQLKGGESQKGVVRLDLVGTGKTTRVYLGAYSGEHGAHSYHGSLESSPRLLKWFEKATARVRAAVLEEQRRRIEGKQKRGRK